MGWKSANRPPDTNRDVICKCDTGCSEYRVLVGWYYESQGRWVIACFQDAVVVQWHEIPKGWKRKEKK